MKIEPHGNPDYCKGFNDGLAAAAHPPKCTWSSDCEDCYSTQCGRHFMTNEGTVEDNGFSFCIYCGGEIEAIEVDDDDAKH